jgi:hypothetical protein
LQPVPWQLLATLEFPWKARPETANRRFAELIDSTKFYFTLVDAPIRAYSPLRLGTKRMACSIAAFIGRFYGRR